MTYPDCIYLLGDGKWSGPVYDADKYGLWTADGWTRNAPYFVVAPKVAENTYQATMSMSTDNGGWRVLLEFYSDLAWGQTPEVLPIAITGDNAARFYLDGSWLCGVDDVEDPFEPGNYRLTITTAAEGATVDIKKID